jgi:hypothetical protein
MIRFSVVRRLDCIDCAGYHSTLYRNVFKERYSTVQYINGCVVCSVLLDDGVWCGVVCVSSIAYVKCDRMDGDVM